MAFDPVLATSGAFGRAISTLGAVRRGAIELHKLCIVHVSAERAFDRFKISLVAI
jgi:hypothetical protein